jgi:hypothetical protein
MDTSQIQKNPEQLTFDFSARTKNILRKSPILTKHTTTGFFFHPDASTLMEDRFVIKASYLGRSYRISGQYRIKQSRSFWNSDEVSREAVGINFGLIECFINGRYIPGYVPMKDEIKLKKEAEKLLTNPLTNQNLAIHHDQDIFA